jgi:hypothetical protein
VFLHDCANATQSLKRLEIPPLFVLIIIIIFKIFNYIAKDASIFHLKLSNDSIGLAIS